MNFHKHSAECKDCIHFADVMVEKILDEFSQIRAGLEHEIIDLKEKLATK